MTPIAVRASMTEAEAHACPSCERCGAHLTRPASRFVPDYDRLHWACMTPAERDDLREIERDARELYEDVRATDAGLRRALRAEDCGFLNERVRLGT